MSLARNHVGTCFIHTQVLEWRSIEENACEGRMSVAARRQRVEGELGGGGGGRETEAERKESAVSP